MQTYLKISNKILTMKTKTVCTPWFTKHHTTFMVYTLLVTTCITKFIWLPYKYGFHIYNGIYTDLASTKPLIITVCKFPIHLSISQHFFSLIQRNRNCSQVKIQKHKTITGNTVIQDKFQHFLITVLLFTESTVNAIRHIIIRH